MITRFSILAVNDDTGGRRVFRSANEAAREIGVTEGAVRYALRNGGLCRGWRFDPVPTVVVVRMRDDWNYYVCEVAEGGGGYDMLGEDGGYIQARDVAELWDVTENFNRIRNGKAEKK